MPADVTASCTRANSGSGSTRRRPDDGLPAYPSRALLQAVEIVRRNRGAGEPMARRDCTRCRRESGCCRHSWNARRRCPDCRAELASASLRFSWTADRRALPGQPPLPPGTAVVVPPSVAHAAPLAEAARWHSAPAVGVAGTRLRSRRRRTCSDPAESGLRPVFVGIDRCAQTCVPPDRGARGRGQRRGLARSASALETASLRACRWRTVMGLTRLLSAMILGGPFALLEPLDHRTALHTLGLPMFTFWSATAHFADVLGRCALPGPPVDAPGVHGVQPGVASRVRRVPRSIRCAAEAELLVERDGTALP